MKLLHAAVPALLAVMVPAAARAQVPLESKIGQMIMVTVTGDSVELHTPSMDTLRNDLAHGFVGGLVMFTWSGNLQSPGQIAHFTRELQKLSGMPLFLAIDQEGGNVARLSAANGFAATPSAYTLGTVLNSEPSTREAASTMAGWFVETGLNMNLAPVVDVNVNPASPAIGAKERSFSAHPDTVALHAGWFIDEFRRRGIVTTLKHFPGHGSAVGDSHLGFTDVTSTWSPVELLPYERLLASGSVDAVMTAHVFNATLDSLHPATLSPSTINGVLRGQLGYRGLVVSDAMGMQAIATQYGFEQALEMAVLAGVDMVLYTRNLDSAGGSLPRGIVEFLARRVAEGAIPESRIHEAYARIISLKQRYLTGSDHRPSAEVAAGLEIANYPNPFNTSTMIRFSVPREGTVSLIVYDLLGKVVARVVHAAVGRGVHEFRLDAPVASGVYLCRLEAVGAGRDPWRASKTHRMIVLR